jgi:hypothetical protein
MTRQSVVLFLALAGGVASAVQADRDMKNRPISKVVTLLKDMTTQLSKEAEEDEEVFEALGCWCETNDREKTKAIADAETRIKKLNADIEKFAGTSSQMNTEISNLQAELAKNQEALDTATALREKQLAEFTEEEKDMLGSISSLGNAVTVLGKHKSAFLQLSDVAAINIAATIREQLRKHKFMLAEVVSPSQRRMLEAFAQPEEFAALQQGSAYNPAYKPQGGAILGVLQSMLESFQTNLAKSQEEEHTNQQAYEDLKAAKTAEIKAGTDQTETKTGLMAEADEKHAQSKTDLSRTEETLDADTKFLASVKEHCANVDAEYEERVKTRQLEMQAVSKAMSVLTSDEAQDLIADTLGLVQKPSAFLQLNEKRIALVKELKATAKLTRDPRLSTLAMRARIDAFGKVKESLQGMIDNLLKEKDEEIAKKDFCIDSLNQNLRVTETRHREKADAEAKVEDHLNAMEKLTKKIEEDHAQIAELRVQLKKATEDREKANKDFQETVADQRATQKLLTAALGVLKGFYEKPALMQARAGAAQKAPAGPPPPPGFKKYSNNAQSGGVMNMIQTICDDAKAMEAEALAAEETNQQAYEDFVKDTNDAVISLQKDIATKTEEKAREEQDKVSQEGTRDQKASEIEQLKKENLDLHFECDYMIKNFDIRMEARDAEVEALKQGLATFSGASFNSFLQSTK